jgi:hypothetical protein
VGGYATSLLQRAGDAIQNQFCLDDIKYDGKIAARGTSFQSHIDLATQVYDSYTGQIQHLETTYPIRAKTGEHDHWTIGGDAIEMRFSRPVTDLEGFCQSLFSATEPFRLWGVPVQAGDSYYTVEAVDLHVGGTLRFEITHEWMLIYLADGTCGNTVLRVFTNLQRTLDAQIGAFGGDGESVFGF